MLNMGFVEDVEKILSGGASDQVQTMLFSATLPSWVKSITARFLNKSHKTVDLVGTEKLKVRVVSQLLNQLLGLCPCLGNSVLCRQLLCIVFVLCSCRQEAEARRLPLHCTASA